MLVAEYAESLNDLGTARAWLDGLVEREPRSREALRALSAFAKRHGDALRALRAERGLAALAQEPNAEAELNAALMRADLPAARAAATRLRLPPGELALRAVRAGATPLGTEQAALALGADPNDANAWVAALSAADLSRDRQTLERLLREDPVSPSPPNPLALELLGEALARLVGEEARAAWGSDRAAVSKKDR
ncbi:MAG: hypothetical protein QM756_31645 [Polyangiaceae bacterium]